MLIKRLWKYYIAYCTTFYYKSFQNDYFMLFCFIFITPFCIIIDIFLLPLEIVTLLISKIFDKIMK